MDKDKSMSGADDDRAEYFPRMTGRFGEPTDGNEIPSRRPDACVVGDYDDVLFLGFVR